MDRHMNVRFYSPQYDFLGMADEATVIFTGRWHTYGQFEIYLDQMEPYIQQGNRIIWGRDNRKNGIIEYINVADDGSVTIKGYTLLWLLSQRITVPDAGAAYLSYNTNVEDIMYDLVRKNAVNCSDTKRNFANLTCGTSQGRGQKLSYQTRYDGLLDCLSELSKYSMLGLSVRVDLDACKEVFEVLGGTDRSLAQDINPQVVFRRSYDNIEKEIYTYNDSNTKNCAYVAGQGEGAERQIRMVGDDYAGEDRREILIDARDIEDPEQLPARGETKLAEYAAEESFEVTALADEYGKRWTMGDRVTIIGENSGVSLDTYITEVEETWDEKGYDVIPTFGNPVQTLGQQTASGGSAGSTGSGSSSAGMGARGYSLQYNWQGTSLGVKREDEAAYRYTDLQGPAGPQGLQGEKGDTGATGPQGPRGETGPQGNTGPQGEAGPRGLQGEKGDIGPQGPKGDTGESFTYNLVLNDLCGRYNGGSTKPGVFTNISKDGYIYTTTDDPHDLIGFIAKKISGDTVTISGETDLEKIILYYTFYGDTGTAVANQANVNVYPDASGHFETTLDVLGGGTVLHFGVGLYPYVQNYTVAYVKLENGSKATKWAPAQTETIGPQGPKGETGPQGPTGPAGADGTKIYTQASAPSGVASGTVWLAI